jgi:hypothetical protein
MAVVSQPAAWYDPVAGAISYDDAGFRPGEDGGPKRHAACDECSKILTTEIYDFVVDCS